MKIINYTTEQIDEAFGNTFHKRLDKKMWMNQYAGLLGDLETTQQKLRHIEMIVGLNEKSKEEWNKKYKPTSCAVGGTGEYKSKDQALCNGKDNDE